MRDIVVRNNLGNDSLGSCDWRNVGHRGSFTCSLRKGSIDYDVYTKSCTHPTKPGLCVFEMVIDKNWAN